MEKIKKDYSIGLDIGTASVGWAVTDEKGKLIRIKGKRAMGSRLFESAETAIARRVFRTTRRRLQRRKQRILWLQEIMASAVAEKDQNFFKKLEVTKYFKEDSAGYKGQYNFFNDIEYTDKDYNKQFPTIYHLRKHLMETREQVDPRLLYLALHHMMKYRGHFLFGDTEFKAESTDSVKEALLELFNSEVINKEINEEIVEKMLEVFKNTKLNATRKREEIQGLFVNPKEKQVIELLKAVLGLKAKYTLIFNNSELELEDKALEFALKNNDELDKYDHVLVNYSEQFEQIKTIYSWITLQGILVGQMTISDAMIIKYDTHKEQLLQLKALLKENQEDFDKVFKTKKGVLGLYEGYMKAPRKNSYDDFKKALKKILSNYECEELSALLEDDLLLMKQNTTDNSQIPYQLHMVEMIKTLDLQAKYYDLDLNKLVVLMKYRIPYYVGPLNHPTSGSNFSWSIRKEEGKITPWNFNEKIDLDASAEKFIKRMTNKCTYLYGEDVLPKNSLLYKKFMVLNELNQITIITAASKPKKLTPEAKEAIINGLFLKKSSVTEKDLKEFAPLVNEYAGIKEINGFSDNNKFANNLKPYRDFSELLENTLKEKDVERIIEWLTLFEDREIVIRKLNQEYPQLTKIQVNYICKLKYGGWGRLSKKLLVGLKSNINGEMKSIIDVLEDNNDVFMKVINDKALEFKQQIEDSFTVNRDEITYENVKELAGSPAIKKGIWQSLLVVKEIVSIMGYEPTNIFVEMAREEGEKIRTKSRKKQLEELYKEAGDITKELRDELHHTDEKEITLKEKLYLYFIQKGMCLYSGERLELSELAGSLYEVDHILPRSLVKDDSFENKALVMKKYNQIKGDTKLVMDLEVAKGRYKYWKDLEEKKLIGPKKFKNLTRTSISEDEVAGFIQRQLVETRQITKHVVQLLHSTYTESSISTIKANLSSDFRKKYDFPKLREVNHHHHAFDAFLSIQLGLFILNKYPSLEKDVLYGEYNKIKKISDKVGDFGFVINGMKSGFVVKNTDVPVTIEDILKHTEQAYTLPEVIVTKKLEENNGAYYDQMLVGKKEKLNTLGINKFTNEPMDPLKYGGYNSEKIQYSVVVRRKKVTKKETTEYLDLVGIPVRIVAQLKVNENAIHEYLVETIGNDFVIVKDKVKKYQLFIVDGHPLRLASTGEWHNAKELHLPKEFIHDIKKKENLDGVFLLLTIMMEQHYPIYISITKKIEKNDVKTKFAELTKEDKLVVVMKMLKVLASGPARMDLRNLGLTLTEGRLDGKPTNCSDWIFVDESVTGLLRREYTL